MPLNDIYQARIVTFQGVQTAYMVRHYTVQAITGIELTPQQLATALDTQFSGLVKQLANNNATYRGVGVKRLTAPASVEVNSIAGNGLGLGGADSLPTQTAGLIRLYTTTPGRHGHGRSYAPFPSEQHSDVNGRPTGPYGTALAALGVSLLLNVTVTVGADSTTWAPGIYRRANGTFIKFVPGGFSVALANWATQRRRGGLGKANPSPF